MHLWWPLYYKNDASTNTIAGYLFVVPALKLELHSFEQNVLQVKSGFEVTMLKTLSYRTKIAIANSRERERKKLSIHLL